MYSYKFAAARIIHKVCDSITVDELAAMMEYPPNPEMGDIAFPCFKLSKILRKSPVMIADSFRDTLISDNDAKEIFDSIESVSGYLNLKVREDALCEDVKSMLDKGTDYGSSNVGEGKTIVIDYSSPNIAKPFHIGHLRSTVIGQSIKNIFKFSGYNCVGVNHLGDWGTQFGKLITAYKLWGDKDDIEARGIKALNEIYVKFHKEAEEKPELEDEARANFAKMEQGDEEALSLWKWFVDISINEFKKTYDLIGADFESWRGESFYFDKTDAVVDELKAKDLLKFDDGAYIVPLDEYDMPPCLILKGDGSTIYATRDIAAAMFRKNSYNFDKCIYVTSAGQSLHFAQFFKVIGLMGYDWSEKLVHVPFGTVSFGGAKIATRTGNMILLEDIFEQAIEKTTQIIDAKNPNLENKEDVAKAVGVGAIIFNDLSNNRIRDVDFDMEEALSFEGNTGPYVQYTYARCEGIIEKSGITVDSTKLSITDGAESSLIKILNMFPEKVTQARNDLEPSVISRYLLDVCAAFNRFYHDCPVLKVEDATVKNTRLALVSATANVLKSGLTLIGLKTPKNI
ncbi:MAG: arginine--tRNA ligase [Clostridia bacterium]|nr:arginine--tRNA ligase [Clostridia bacterium]